jgi:hypothetical protein
LNTASVNEQSQYISGLHEYREKVRAQLYKKLDAYRYQLDVPIDALVNASIQAAYQLTLSPVIEEFKARILHFELLASYQLQPEDLSMELRSLLYFQSTWDYMKAAFEQIASERAKPVEGKPGTTPVAQATELSAAALIPLNGGGHAEQQPGKRPWTAHPGKGKRQQEAGKESEETVKNYLEHTYGREWVRWRSGFSDIPDQNDNLQYDILYKNDEGNWKLVEVKTLGPTGFIISQLEVAKGERNPDRYEIFLVSGQQIYIIRDFFKFLPGESFESNSRYGVRAKDYHVDFRISTHVNIPENVIPTGQEVNPVTTT